MCPVALRQELQLPSVTNLPPHGLASPTMAQSLRTESALSAARTYESARNGSRHSLWRPGDPASGRDGVQAEADGGDRRPADRLAHHAALRQVWRPALRALPRLQG